MRYVNAIVELFYYTQVNTLVVRTTKCMTTEGSDIKDQSQHCMYIL